jgi:hypothetical protein
MKKYTSLFALLIIMTLLIIETVPQYHVFSQGCTDPKTGRPITCPPAGSSGGPEKPGPKNRKPTPMPVPPTPTLVVLQPLPYPHPYPISYPQAYPTSVTKLSDISVPPRNLCVIGPCWPFNINPGDPVEMLAGGGFIVFVVVIAFAFFRGRMNSGGR